MSKRRSDEELATAKLEDLRRVNLRILRRELTSRDPLYVELRAVKGKLLRAIAAAGKAGDALAPDLERIAAEVDLHLSAYESDCAEDSKYAPSLPFPADGA